MLIRVTTPRGLSWLVSRTRSLVLRDIHTVPRVSPRDRDTDMLRIAIVDDSPTVRLLLANTLATLSSTTIVVEFGDTDAAITGLMAAPADAIVLDVHLRAGSSLEVLNYVKRTQPVTKVFVFSGTDDEDVLRPFAQAGADAFFDKGAGLDALYEALKRLAAV